MAYEILEIRVGDAGHDPSERRRMRTAGTKYRRSAGRFSIVRGRPGGRKVVTLVFAACRSPHVTRAGEFPTLILVELPVRAIYDDNFG